MPKKISPTLIGLVIAVLLFFVIGEHYLRYFSYYGVDYIIELGDDVAVRDPELVWVNQDQIDDLSEYFQERPAWDDSYRIFVIGDSIAGGGELQSSEHLFSNILEDLLNKKYPDRVFEVITYGVGGYNTLQEARFYETKGKFAKPDLIILQYCSNDSSDGQSIISRKNGKQIIRFYKQNVSYVKGVPFNCPLTEKFLVTRSINEAVITFFRSRDLPINIGYCLTSWERTYNALVRLKKAADSSGAAVLVVGFPQLVEINSLEEVDMFKKLENWCKELQFPYVDLLDPYDAYEFTELRCDPKDDIHPNLLGNRIAAEHILRTLEESGLLDQQ